MEFIIFLAILGVISWTGVVWTYFGIKRDERNGLHEPLPNP